MKKDKNPDIVESETFKVVDSCSTPRYLQNRYTVIHVKSSARYNP